MKYSFLTIAFFLALATVFILIMQKVKDHIVAIDEEHNPLARVQNGDIIFQTSLSRQSKAIQLATHSQYSHMGIIYIEGGKPYVYEAIQPVKITPMRAWVKRGKGGKYVVKRLKNADKLLTPATLIKMKALGKKYKGKNYDIYFEWSDKNIYCSELVWKIYKEGAGIEIGALQKLKDFDLSNPTVKKMMKERYGNNIPFEEKVISPLSMFEDNKLMLVAEWPLTN